MLATAAAAATDAEARARLDRPFDVKELDERFAHHQAAFNLDGPGPLFMQDYDDLAEAEPGSINALLIDAPGEQTLKDNKDHFVKRDGVNVLCRAAAAMALHTLQTYAPSGGAGHRTSLRGGGPLTCLIEDPARKTLWARLWMSTETRQDIDGRNHASDPKADSAAIFPWMAPARTSNPKAGGRATTQSDVHALQVYWGMPRRIRLVFEDGGERPCDLTGRVDSRIVAGFRMVNYGTNYTDGFEHPLTPHYRSKADAPLLPIHGQPGGAGYRHWLGWIVQDAGELRKPAAIVTAAHEGHRWSRTGEFALRVLGYDMDNMKARGFATGTLPVIAEPEGRQEDEERLSVGDLCRRLIPAADQAKSLLLRSVKEALHAETSDMEILAERFWRETEAEFYVALRQAARAEFSADGGERICKTWLAELARTALALYDEATAIDSPSDINPFAIAAPRRNLTLALHGYGKAGESLFNALRLPPPKKKSAAKSKTRNKE